MPNSGFGPATSGRPARGVKFVTMFLFLMGLSLLPPLATASDAVRVQDQKLCARVTERNCIEPLNISSGTVNIAAGDVIWWWLSLSVEGDPTPIRIVWYRDGVEVSRRELSLQPSKSFRTWANKRIGPGSWKAEALSPDEAVLATVEFRIPLSGQAPTP